MHKLYNFLVLHECSCFCPHGSVIEVMPCWSRINHSVNASMTSWSMACGFVW